MSPFRIISAVISAGILGGFVAAILCKVPFDTSSAHAAWAWGAIGVFLALMAVMPLERR